jgi:acetamidase/formamidase
MRYTSRQESAPRRPRPSRRSGADGLGSVDVTGSGTPDTVIAPRGERVLDGFSRVMHDRWNRDLEPTVTVRPGKEIQLLCRDALDIGDQARTLTPDGSLTLDLGRIHPLAGPVEVEGAEPGDILEVEILDASPIVDFGDVTVSPALGMFGALRPEPLAQFAAWTEPSQLSDPSAGAVPAAIPANQPYNGGAAFVQLFHFERGQNTGFATFVGSDDQGYYITTGTGTDLMENAKNAVREMIDWLVVDQQLGLHEAYVLCSVAGDLKIPSLPRSLKRSTCRTGSSR